MITPNRLKQLFDYDPATGTFTRKLNAGSATGGQIAGCRDRSGYIRISVDCQRFAAHRLAFLFMTGKLPALHIDHINGDRGDNRWLNLREVTRTENNRNKCNRSDNTSGHPGITWLPRNKKWRARISTDARRISLGLFNSIDQAIAARKEAEAQLGYQPNHGRRAAA